MNTDILSHAHLIFNDSDSLFQSLSNETKKYLNGFWGTTILVDRTPFYFEISQLKKGRKLKQTPKNKEDKTFHLQNKDGEVIAMYSYTKGWDEPCYYDFIKKSKDIVEIFTFDIEKKLETVQQNFMKDSRINESVFMWKNGNYIVEIYHYDNFNRIVEIEREHKDKQQFWDINLFPNNTYNSIFVLKYNDSEVQPFMILSGTNHQKELKQVWIKE
jgi:hypothetical protein